jgi:Tfp pilus assembly protein PilN
VINLMPPELKETYRYGRRNRALAHWLTIMVFCLIGAMLLTGGGYLYLNRSINNTNQQLAESQQQLSQQHEASVQKQVTDITKNLKLATQVLSKEILFSKLLKQLGAVTPNNAVLTNLSITQAQEGVDITAETTNYAAATQLQINLADPKNKIFSQADIVSITCNSGSGNKSQYPCTVNIRALFAQNNPFLFINDTTGGGK